MSRRLPALTARDVIRALERGGFFLHHARGGHRFYRHESNVHLRVTVSYHSGDLRRATLRSIIEQSGLTEEAFLALL